MATDASASQHHTGSCIRPCSPRRDRSPDVGHRNHESSEAPDQQSMPGSGLPPMPPAGSQRPQPSIPTGAPDRSSSVRAGQTCVPLDVHWGADHALASLPLALPGGSAVRDRLAAGGKGDAIHRAIVGPLVAPLGSVISRGPDCVGRNHFSRSGARPSAPLTSLILAKEKYHKSVNAESPRATSPKVYSEFVSRSTGHQHLGRAGSGMTERRKAADVTCADDSCRPRQVTSPFYPLGPPWQWVGLRCRQSQRPTGKQAPPIGGAFVSRGEVKDSDSLVAWVRAG